MMIAEEDPRTPRPSTMFAVAIPEPPMVLLPKHMEDEHARWRGEILRRKEVVPVPVPVVKALAEEAIPADSKLWATYLSVGRVDFHGTVLDSRLEALCAVRAVQAVHRNTEYKLHMDAACKKLKAAGYDHRKLSLSLMRQAIADADPQARAAILNAIYCRKVAKVLLPRHDVLAMFGPEDPYA